MRRLFHSHKHWLSVLAILLFGGCSALQRQTPPSDFHGFASEDQLIDEFLAALAVNDQHAMDRLRVTEAEYRNVIIPGSAPVGKSMEKPLTDTKFNYFWSMLNQKSQDFSTVILRDYGGSQWRRTHYWYTKEPKQLSGYRALGQVRIDAEDGQGRKATIRTGWIADVAGQFKFIGFQYKD